jgi:cell division protein FtsQ
MPRLTAERLVQAKPASRAAPRLRAKKSAPRQDRLSARTLFFRRVRRSIKPGIWVLGGITGLLILTQIFRALPSVEPVASPAGTMRHGLASIAGAAGFRISAIDITGADTTPIPAIKAALGVQTGDPIFGISLAAMQARLNALGPVQSATVRRALPGTLIVNITERAVYAIWQDNPAGAPAHFVLIDRAGDIIANQDAIAAKRRNPALLLLVGADAPANAQALVTELRASPAVLARVVAAERVDGLRWNLTLKNQTLVKLPTTDESNAVGQLAALQSSIALLDRPVEVIDLRMPGRLIVRPYPAAPATPATAPPGQTVKAPQR